MINASNYIVSIFKKHLSLLLAFFILSSSIHADELLKLPKLLHHYTDHCKLVPEENIGSFLYKHYVIIEDDATDTDKETDETLPFKSDNSWYSHISLFNMYTSAVVYTSAKSELIKSHPPVKFISNYFAEIWNPPDNNNSFLF